jgi:hypothetical protein
MLFFYNCIVLELRLKILGRKNFKVWVYFVKLYLGIEKAIKSNIFLGVLVLVLVFYGMWENPLSNPTPAEIRWCKFLQNNLKTSSQTP